MRLKIGDRAPRFSGLNDKGERFCSRDLLGKSTCVIYFYPKDFTPECSKEACGFRDWYQEFKYYDAEVIGVSSDEVSSHKRFKEKYQLPFTILSDNEGKLKKLFGIKSGILGVILGRETYVIDKKGIIQLVYKGMLASRHIDKAIAKVKEIANE